MALALVVATAALLVGSLLGFVAYGIIWGLVAAAGLLLALRMGGVETDLSQRVVLTAGFVASTIAATRVLPDTPETIDVRLCLQFAAAWIPAGIACAWVARRHRARPASSLNTVLVWILGGAFAIPAAQTLGVLRPIDSLRRGLEPEFGRGDYAIIALIVAAVGLAAFLAAVTRLPGLATGSAIILFTVFAGASVGFTITGLIAKFSNIANLPNFWPPDFGWAIGEGTWWWLPSWEFGAPLRANPIIETIRIGITATVIGCLVALPVAFMASTLTSPNKTTYLVDKGFMNLTRTIPDLFWAAIFVASVGGGAFAGTLALTIFSMAIMAKLLSETIDAASPGPLEAAKAAGSQHFPAIRTAVLPQVLPNYVAYSLYIFELSIRASFVIGLVGGGGIGRVLEAQRVFYQFDRILAIVIVIGIVVFILEQISVALRRRLV
jgi:phosphonate transport system permease protein